MSSSRLARAGSAFRLYSPRQAERIIRRYDDWLQTMQEHYGVPCGCIKTVLFQEMTAMDGLDILADWSVKLYWLKYGLLSRLRRICKMPPYPGFPGGLLRKRDSSTGYGQVFARTAIQAIRFSLEKGLDESPQALGLKNVPDDAYEPVSNAPESVSPVSTVILSIGMQSMSLVTFAMMVSSPVPISAAPDRTIIDPSISSFATAFA